MRTALAYVEPTADVGVIIGRFQVADLHDGHTNLINEVIARHRKVVVLLGLAPIPNSTTNPLDFESRKQMLVSAYPDLIVLYVRDINNDALWSKQVDDTIAPVVGPNQTVMLYGSRDSFITHYSGRYPTFELPSGHSLSGTQIRAELGSWAQGSPAWRAGVIWASRNRFPTCYTTVDVAIFNEERTELLLGRKAGSAEWCLIGGFADPGSLSFEDDAARESMEEAGVNLLGLRYVRSQQVDDWRYQSEPDCIKTLLFVATTADEPVAGDDIEEVAWFDTAEFDSNHMWEVQSCHRKLVTYALLAIKNERN